MGAALFVPITIIRSQSSEPSSSQTQTGRKLPQTTNPASSDSKFQFNLGFELLQKGHLTDALVHLQKSAKDPAFSGESRFLLGVDWFELRNYEKAIAELTDLVDSAHAERVLYMLEESNRLMNRQEQARQFFRQLNQRFPDSAWIHFLMATAYENQEQLDKAISEYKQALQKDHSLPNANFAIGYLYWRQQNSEEAKPWFETEVRAGCHALANFFLGEIARTNTDPQKAEFFYRQSIHCDPSYPDAHLRLGMVLETQHHYSEAIAELKKAVALKPDQSAPHYRLALLYRKTGQTAKAEDEYAQMHRLQAASGADSEATKGAHP